jgi:glucose dehydrogenase
LPQFKRFSHAAVLAVDESAGKARVQYETRHVDYWFFSEFEPLKAITAVEPIR